MFNDFFLGGGGWLKVCLSLYYCNDNRDTNIVIHTQHSRALENSGAYHMGIYYWRVFICLLRLSQSGLSWGLCFPLGQLCVSCRSGGGSSAPQDLPPPTACCPEGRLCQRVLFSWWCRNMGDFPRPRVGNWHTIIGQVQSQGTRRDTRPPLSLWKGVDTEKRGDLESLTQSTAESTLDATIWISESSIVWSPSNHPSNTLWALHLGHDSWTLGIL